MPYFTCIEVNTYLIRLKLTVFAYNNNLSNLIDLNVAFNMHIIQLFSSA